MAKANDAVMLLPPRSATSPPKPASAKAEIAEIEENLLRRDLDTATKATLTARLVELRRSKEEAAKKLADEKAGEVLSQCGTKLPPKTHKPTGVGRGTGGGRPKSEASVRAIAKEQGRSKDQVHRDLQTVAALGTETLERVPKVDDALFWCGRLQSVTRIKRQRLRQRSKSRLRRWRQRKGERQRGQAVVP